MFKCIKNWIGDRLFRLYLRDGYAVSCDQIFQIVIHYPGSGMPPTLSDRTLPEEIEAFLIENKIVWYFGSPPWDGRDLLIFSRKEHAAMFIVGFGGEIYSEKYSED
jgi:hypothetical protein